MSHVNIYDPNKEKRWAQQRQTWRQAIESAKDAKDVLNATKKFYPNAVGTMLSLNIGVYICCDNPRMIRLCKAALALLHEEQI